MFVFGFDSDTPATTRATVSFALAEKIDSAQFLILTPLPGSGFYKKMIAEGRLIDNAWDTYDAHHVKFLPRGFTPWELQVAQIGAHARFYSPWHVLARLFRGSTAGFVIGRLRGCAEPALAAAGAEVPAQPAPHAPRPGPGLKPRPAGHGPPPFLTPAAGVYSPVRPA